MRRRSNHHLLLVLMAATALVLAGCGTEAAETTTSTTGGAVTTSTTPASTTTGAVTSSSAPTLFGYKVYFMLESVDSSVSGPFLVPVYREASPADDPVAALGLLFEGPSHFQQVGVPAMTTAIPSETEVLGVTVAAGVATVNLSDEYDDGGGSFGMFARLAQVVYTMTAIPGIDSVWFVIDGEPVTVFSSEGIILDEPQSRDGYYDLRSRARSWCPGSPTSSRPSHR